jgi:hypothetical protein
MYDYKSWPLLSAFGWAPQGCVKAQSDSWPACMIAWLVVEVRQHQQPCTQAAAAATCKGAHLCSCACSLSHVPAAAVPPAVGEGAAAAVAIWLAGPRVMQLVIHVCQWRVAVRGMLHTLARPGSTAPAGVLLAAGGMAATARWHSTCCPPQMRVMAWVFLKICLHA